MEVKRARCTNDWLNMDYLYANSCNSFIVADRIVAMNEKIIPWVTDSTLARMQVWCDSILFLKYLQLKLFNCNEDEGKNHMYIYLYVLSKYW